MKFDVYLQGSYANATNIYANSDVDVVVEGTSVFYSNLTSEEKQQLSLGKGGHNWTDFRARVLQALTEYYGGGQIETGAKSIKVAAAGGRLAADVVPSIRHKRYKNLSVEVTGMTFWSDGGQVVNFPKLHRSNGSRKNAPDHTNAWFKPTVRIFKNARERVAQEDGSLRGRYPSYFVECLLHTAADDCYGGTFQDTFAAVVNDLDARLSSGESLVCQNGCQWLFGDSSVQWDVNDAVAFIDDVSALSNHW